MAAPTTTGLGTSTWKVLNNTAPDCGLLDAQDRKKAKRCEDWLSELGPGLEIGSTPVDIGKRTEVGSTETASSAEPTASSIFEAYDDPFTALNLTGRPFLDCPAIARRGLTADFCPSERIEPGALLNLDGTSTTVTGDKAVSGEDEKRSVPFPTNVPSFPAGGPSGFRSIWTELADRDAPAEASLDKRSSTLEVPHGSFKAEKGTTTDSAKRSLSSGLLGDCASVVRRGEALPKRCEGIIPTWVNKLPVWDVNTDPIKRSSLPECPIVARRGDLVVRRCTEEETETVHRLPGWFESLTSENLPVATGGSSYSTVDRREIQPCPYDADGGCGDISAWLEEQEDPLRQLGSMKPGVEAVAKRRAGLGMDKRVVLQPGMEPVDTPTHIGDLTLHIG